jgi:hypothetical protein
MLCTLREIVKTIFMKLVQVFLASLMSLCHSNQSGVRIRTGTRALSLFQNVQTGSGVHPAPYSMAPGLFHGGTVACV